MERCPLPIQTDFHMFPIDDHEISGHVAVRCRYSPLLSAITDELCPNSEKPIDAVVFPPYGLAYETDCVR